MRVLITGGAGFIGSHLAEALLAAGYPVSVLDDLSTGSIDNLGAVLGHPRFAFSEGTILDRRLVHAHVSACDYVVHLAAAVGVRTILEKPLASLRTNVEGSACILNACQESGRPVLLASTSETYGKNDADSLCEDADSILGSSAIDRWSYATAKKLDEFLGLAHHRAHGLPVTITRFFNIVGPRQSARYGMVLPSFVRAALANQPIRVFGDGLQTRNFTYIDDCIDALLRLMRNPLAAGKIVNIGGSEEISIRELAEHVKRAAASSSPIITVPYHQAYPEGSFEDMRRRVPCICRMEALTGWRPATSLAAIIAKTISFERNRQPLPADRVLA
ncbi:MAG: NAD-dependent epimerase/dehydratase family protein [Bryobacterales bacterium]|nr:NAD-dependent epimerase/dehydratase family protein [Bryobacterales bacterium]